MGEARPFHSEYMSLSLTHYASWLNLRVNILQNLSRKRLSSGTLRPANPMPSSRLQRSGQRHRNCARGVVLQAGSTAATSRLRSPGANPQWATKRFSGWRVTPPNNYGRSTALFTPARKPRPKPRSSVSDTCCVTSTFWARRIEAIPITLHTRCATCGESAAHEKGWQAEVWADIHEFEHSRHRVRLFEHARGKGLKEIGDWRG